MMQSLSSQHAQKLVLLAQRLPPKKQVGSAVAATLSAVEHLGYIQIDTISVVQRAHHHTLWNRNPRYLPFHLDQLLSEKHILNTGLMLPPVSPCATIATVCPANRPWQAVSRITGMSGMSR